MIKVEGGHDHMITVMNTTEYDSYSGSNALKVTLQAGSTLLQMQTDLTNLMYDFNQLKDAQAVEERLRNEHEGLKELYSQYKVVLKLVKTADSKLTEDDIPF